MVVAVLDTGIDTTQPDLIPNLWRNPGETGLDAQGRDKATNGIDDDGDGYVDDVYGIDAVVHNGDPKDRGYIRGEVTAPRYHGSACAGVIGAVGNNGIGTAGINWSVSLMAVRVSAQDLDRDFHEAAYTATILEAFEYVIAMKRRGVNVVVTSNSYGNAAYSQALKDAIDAAGNEGILNVFAAGNNAMNNDDVALYIAGYNSPSILSVGASTRDDVLADFSCYGRSTVHLTAPSPDIVSTLLNDLGGTSAACPQVAGAIALLKAAILGSVDQPAALRSKVMSNGRLNIAKAMLRLTNTASPAIVIAAHPVGPRTRTVDPIEVTFSRPMDRVSVEASFALSPRVPGTFEWSDGGRTFRFKPSVALVHTNYVATLSGSTRDAEGGTLDGDFSGVRQGSPRDDFRWTFGFPVPDDDFADAQLLVGATGSQAGTTRNASPEVGEPDHAGSPLSSPSVWYRWTAPSNGWYSFDTLQHTAFDTLLAVYTGSALTALTPVATNDNVGSSIRSKVSFRAQAGVPYSVAVAAKSYYADKVYLDDSSVGTFGLSWRPTPPPTITSFSPHCGGMGTLITLYGTDLTGGRWKHRA